MKNIKKGALLVILLLAISSLQSCGIFKKDCGCPSVSSGKRR